MVPCSPCGVERRHELILVIRIQAAVARRQRLVRLHGELPALLLRIRPVIQGSQHGLRWRCTLSVAAIGAPRSSRSSRLPDSQALRVVLKTDGVYTPAEGALKQHLHWNGFSARGCTHSDELGRAPASTVSSAKAGRASVLGRTRSCASSAGCFRKARSLVNRRINMKTDLFATRLSEPHLRQSIILQPWYCF